MLWGIIKLWLTAQMIQWIILNMDRVANQLRADLNTVVLAGEVTRELLYGLTEVQIMDALLWILNVEETSREVLIVVIQVALLCEWGVKIWRLIR